MKAKRSREHNLRGLGLSPSFSLYSQPLCGFYTLSTSTASSTRVYIKVATRGRLISRG